MSRRHGGGIKAWPPLLDPCAYCGGPSDTHDHIQAFGEGGLDSWHNRASACKTCNGRKGRRSVLGFLVGMPDHMSTSLMTVPKRHRDRVHRIWSAKRIRRARVLRREAAKIVKREKMLYPSVPTLLGMIHRQVIAAAVMNYRQSVKTGTTRRGR